MPRLSIDVVADIAEIRKNLQQLKLEPITVQVQLDLSKAKADLKALQSAADATDDVVSTEELSRLEKFDRLMERIAEHSERIRPALERAGEIGGQLAERPEPRAQSTGASISRAAEVGLGAIGAAGTAYETYRAIRVLAEYLRKNLPSAATVASKALGDIGGKFVKFGTSFAQVGNAVKTRDLVLATDAIGRAQLKAQAVLRAVSVAQTAATNPRQFLSATPSRLLTGAIREGIRTPLAAFLGGAFADEIVANILVNDQAKKLSDTVIGKIQDRILPPTRVALGGVRPGSVSDVFGRSPVDQIGAMRARAAMRTPGFGIAEAGVGRAGASTAEAAAALRKLIEQALGPEEFAKIRAEVTALASHIRKEITGAVVTISAEAASALKTVVTEVSTSATNVAKTGIGKAAVAMIEESRRVGTAVKAALSLGVGGAIAGIAVGFDRLKTIFAGVVAGSRILAGIGEASGSVAIGVAKATSAVVEFGDKLKAIIHLPFGTIGESFSKGMKGATGGIAEKITAGLKAATLKSADVIEPVTRAGASVLRFGASFLRVLGVVTGFWATAAVLAVQGVAVVTRGTRQIAKEFLSLRASSGIGIEAIADFKESVEAAGLKLSDLAALHEAFSDRIAERRREGAPDLAGIEGAPDTAGLTTARAADVGLRPLLEEIKRLDESGDKVAAFKLALEQLGPAAAGSAIQIARALQSGDIAPSPEAIAAVQQLSLQWEDFKKRFTEFFNITIFSKIKAQWQGLMTSLGEALVTNMGRGLETLKIITSELEKVEARVNRPWFSPQGFAAILDRAREVGASGPSILPGLNIANALQGRATSAQQARAKELMETQARTRPLTDEEAKGVLAALKQASVDLMTPVERIREGAKETIKTVGDKLRRNALASGATDADAERVVDAFAKQINEKAERDIAALAPKPTAVPKPKEEPRDNTFKALQRQAAVEAKIELQQIRELGASRLSALETLRRAELISESEFLAERKAIRDEVFRAEEAEQQREVARRLQASKAPDLTPIERIDAVTAYKEAVADLKRLQDDYADNARDGWLEQTIRVRDLKREVEDLRDEINRAGAPEGLASYLRVLDQQKKVRESIARELSTTTDPRIDEALNAKLKQLDRQATNAQFRGITTDAQAGIGSVTARLGREEQRLELSMKSGAINQFQFMTELGEARKRAVADYTEYIAKIEAANAVIRDPAVAEAIAAMRAEVEKLAASTEVLRDRFATAIGDTIGNTLEKLTTGQVKSLKDLVVSFSTDLHRAINSIVIQGLTSNIAGPDGPLGGISKFLAEKFGGLVKGSQAPAPVRDADMAKALGIGAEEVADKALEAVATDLATEAMFSVAAAAEIAALSLDTLAASSASSGGGDLLESVISAAAQTAHSGGIVGAAGSPSRVVPMAAFRRAPRFHLGGIASNEVPIVAMKGEGIFTPAQMARLAPVSRADNRPSLQVYNQFTLQTPADRRTQSQVAHQAGVGVQRAMKRNG